MQGDCAMNIRSAACLALLLFSGSIRAEALAGIGQLAWSNRVILVFAETALTQALQAELQRAQDEIEQRHIVWLLVSGGKVQTNFPGPVAWNLEATLIRDWKDAQTSLPQVILIGKDGGEKLRNNRLNLDAVFAAIDRMPMRQHEMRHSDGV